METLVLSGEQWRAMRHHVEAALPYEACGLLAGRPPKVEFVIPMRNALASPSRFRMDGREQLRAFDQIDGLSMELMAIFHSHPAGPDVPSSTDVAESAYDVVHVIWSRSAGTWKARGFRIREHGVDEVELHVEPAKPAA